MKKDESLKTFSDINCSNIFLDLPPKANDKKKISKWDLIKVKGFCIAKETIYKMQKKKNPTNWEKIVANDAPNMGLISKV